eukprot:GHVR01058803.1.p1 GENE.GHVR01058803.1~~GHVR01058803.1.p1  ORF type:complete len:179 (-),score=61.21 GHVR01058803.1:192-728(-)
MTLREETNVIKWLNTGVVNSTDQNKANRQNEFEIDERKHREALEDLLRETPRSSTHTHKHTHKHTHTHTHRNSCPHKHSHRHANENKHTNKSTTLNDDDARKKMLDVQEQIASLRSEEETLVSHCKRHKGVGGVSSVLSLYVSRLESLRVNMRRLLEREAALRLRLDNRSHSKKLKIF